MHDQQLTDLGFRKVYEAEVPPACEPYVYTNGYVKLFVTKRRHSLLFSHTGGCVLVQDPEHLRQLSAILNRGR